MRTSVGSLAPKATLGAIFLWMCRHRALGSMWWNTNEQASHFLVLELLSEFSELKFKRNEVPSRTRGGTMTENNWGDSGDIFYKRNYKGTLGYSAHAKFLHTFPLPSIKGIWLGPLWGLSTCRPKYLYNFQTKLIPITFLLVPYNESPFKILSSVKKGFALAPLQWMLIPSTPSCSSIFRS